MFFGAFVLPVFGNQHNGFRNNNVFHSVRVGDIMRHISWFLRETRRDDMMIKDDIKICPKKVVPKNKNAPSHAQFGGV